jgi:hypothetical protein
MSRKHHPVMPLFPMALRTAPHDSKLAAWVAEA